MKVRCRILDGPAQGRIVTRNIRAPGMTWVSHGPLGLLYRYKRVSFDKDTNTAEYRYDEKD